MNSDVPFGFGTPDDPEKKPGDGPAEPVSPGFTSGGSAGGANSGFPGMGEEFDMANLGAALQQIGALLQSAGGSTVGGVNWDLATDIARKAIAEAGDPSVSETQTRAVKDAFGLAEVWLDPATEFPATGGEPAVWSRSEWLVETFPAWKKIVAPVAEQVQNTMTTMMPGPDSGPMSMPGLPEGLPPEIASQMGALMNVARGMGSALFGMQIGQGLAALAGEVVSSSDIGIPLTSHGHGAMVPSNVASFGDGLELPASDVMVYLSLREAAHQRLFAHVPWLRSRVEAAIDAYARGVKIDEDRIQEALSGVDMQNPEAIQEAMASGVFEPEDTEEQKAALARLETLLALVEGWVDDVVDAAAGDRLPSYPQLRETLRRRRATGGPAEKTFATLVGLEMRPRRLREAAELWQQLRVRDGISGRDALWAHPDLLPTSEDLDDIQGFLASSDELDTSELDSPGTDEDTPPRD